MRFKTFIKKYNDVITPALPNNFYNTTWSITKIDDEGNAHTKTYTANITLDMVKRYFGNRQMSDDLVEQLIDDPNGVLSLLNTFKADVLDMQKYRWAALFDIQEMYYNPLYNVDAHESITHAYGQDKTTNVSGQQTNSTQHGQQQNTMLYGADSQTTSYGAESNTLQHGGATDSVQYGNHETDVTHKTNPFNDTENLYNTGKDITEDKTHTDTTTRGTYTDTETRGAKSDTLSRLAHTDTQTAATYTDTDTIGTRTDSSTRDARSDTDTIRRYGNIGVTKSSELLVDAADSIRNVYFEIMKDYIEYITEGY